MAKNKEVEVVKSIGKDVTVCQNCKWHRNNPSYCRKSAVPVGRKNSCDDFK